MDFTIAEITRCTNRKASQLAWATVELPDGISFRMTILKGDTPWVASPGHYENKRSEFQNSIVFTNTELEKQIGDAVLGAYAKKFVQKTTRRNVKKKDHVH